MGVIRTKSKRKASKKLSKVFHLKLRMHDSNEEESLGVFTSREKAVDAAEEFVEGEIRPHILDGDEKSDAIRELDKTGEYDGEAFSLSINERRVD